MSMQKLITVESHQEYHKTVIEGIFIAAIHDTKHSFACFFPFDNLNDKNVNDFFLGFIEMAKQSGHSLKIITNIPMRSINTTIVTSKIPVIKSVAVQGPYEVLFYPSAGKLKLLRLNQVVAANNNARVLIIDDSKTIRQMLRKILLNDTSIEVVGECEDPLLAEELIESTKPNVITLDIHMPKMDGVTLLKKLLPKYNIPTVMITSVSAEEGDSVVSALEEGAVDYIQKPQSENMTKIAPLIIEKVKSAANSKVKSKSALISSNRKLIDFKNIDLTKLIAIGASTGGVDAIKNILIKLPKEIPPIVITQHIPAVFSATLAERLNQICPFEVKEAKDGDEICANRVLIAQGGLQFKVKKIDGKLIAQVTAEDAVNRHKPSVDVLFMSVAAEVGENAIGVILTGMGSDGSKGLAQMHKAGAYTIAQDEGSSVVFGMPKAAINLGGVDQVLSLDEIPQELLSRLMKRTAA